MRIISALTATVAIASLNLSCASLAQDREPTPGNEGMTRHLNAGGKPITPAPDRDMGEGPFERLVIRGATLIDGTGAPPVGPVDIVIENNVITSIQSVGNPGAPIDPEGRPETGDHEIDAHGMYVLPGFINNHAHISNVGQWEYGDAPTAEYVYKLWLAHGITTVRDVGSGNGIDWTMHERDRSNNNEIVAPRIFTYAGFPSHLTPDEATEWVQAIHDAGADGIKFFGAPIETMRAALDKATELGLRTTMHHAQLNVVDLNVLDSARMGLTSMEHWYGLPEALFDDKQIQHYPADYNYNNEQDRFGQAGRLWAQAAEPGSDKWNAVMDELLELDFTLDPTFSIYEASRDVMRARNADWMAEYCWPALWEFFQPSRTAHGSFWLDWTTADEIAWKNNFRKWMTFVNEYKNRGGRVTTGEDAGFIYKVYGFAYIRELEMLQEAGFHPLEVIRSATRNGAELLGRSDDMGTIQRGRLADLVIVDENPIHNLKVLYATGAIRFDDDLGQMTRVGGISYTIKDGIVYDAKQLARQVREMVAGQKAQP